MPRTTIKKSTTTKKSNSQKPKKVLAHISGFPGSGKSTLGKELKSLGYEVKDLDDFLDSKTTQKTMESKIRKWINKTKTKKQIIFVGTGCLEPDQAPNIEAENLIWLNVSIEQSSQQAVQRQLEWLCEHHKEFLTMAKKQSLDNFTEYLENYYNPKKRSQDWSGLFKMCKSMGYTSCYYKDIIKKFSK